LYENGEQIELVFGTEASLGLSYTVRKGILLSPIISVLLSRTFTQTLDLENFATAVLKCHKLKSTVSAINR